MTDIIYWVWLAQKNGAGHADAVKLLKHFPGGARDIYEASYEQLVAASDGSRDFISKLTDHDLTLAERTLEFCFMNGVRVIPCNSPHYPKRLHDLYNKPIVLYMRGMVEDLDDRFCVSIVGTRNMSSYGKHMAFTLARQLIGYGAIVISGAAYGIDSAANSTAAFLEEPTVAVLGSGVNVPYPSENKALIDWIGTHGAVISEFEPNTPPYGRNFPIRNRIISGLSDAVVVVEGGARSGALITARCAQDQGRMVYAVPGNVGAANSIGPNSMIRDGAKLVTRTEDIIEDFTDRFDLKQIERIINSDKYLRYEYNHHVPTRPENKPIKPGEPGNSIGFKIPEIKKPIRSEPLPDIPKPDDYRIPKNHPGAGEEAAAPDDADMQTRHASKSKTKISAGDKQIGTPEPPAKKSAAERERIMRLLDDVSRRVLDSIPDGEPISTDKIAQMGFGAGEVMASLTTLELYAAVEALPGGLYRKLL